MSCIVLYPALYKYKNVHDKIKTGFNIMIVHFKTGYNTIQNMIFQYGLSPVLI